jgi:CHAT domain-containing protein/Tfp pilus assembly protein PilF
LSGCTRRGDPESVFNHAKATFERGNLAAATDEAQKGYQQFRDLSSDWAWKFLILEANTLSWRGMNDQVLALFDREKSPLPAGDLTVQQKWLVANARISSQNFDEAQRSLDEAGSLCAGSHYPSCSDFRAMGWLENARGRFKEAQILFENTVNSARERGDRFLEASALLDLTESALQQERFDEALDWSDRAYRLAQLVDAGHIAQTSLGNQGWAYYKLGEPEKALKLLLDARDRAHKVGATTYEVTWLTTAGYVFLDAHQFAKAEEYYQQAFTLAQRTRKQDVLDALMSLALVCERTGKFDQASNYADQTTMLASKDGDRLNLLYPMLVKGHVAARRHDTRQAEKIYREIEHDPKSHVFLKWESEHSLAQLYEDEKQPDAAEREYRAALSTFEGARYSLHEDTSLPFPANAAGIYDDYIRFLADQGKTSEALQIADYQRGRTLAEGLGVLQKGATFKPDALNAQAIARKVAGTILFYWLGEKQSHLWAITPQKISVFTLPPKSEIEPIAQRYQKALSEQQEFLQGATDDGAALYHMLVEPAGTLLRPDAKVFIIPDGRLNTLNFETLLVPGSTPHYWIEDVTITDASSLRLLAASRARLKRTDNVLLVGNAVSPSSDYPELRNAASEMETIEKHFQPKQQGVFAREQATPAAYLASKPEQYSYIHFVAHGTASRLSPLDSAIVLSRSNTQDDSFKLYARNIIHHPLRAQLVTISTCYGAGSRAYSGEGLVGLSWAFLRAGAHNVIGALWEVSDVSTPPLMDELYSELEKGKTPDTALRNAKLTLLRSSNAFRKPFYWAPFQLYTGS